MNAKECVTSIVASLALAAVLVVLIFNMRGCMEHQDQLRYETQQKRQEQVDEVLELIDSAIDREDPTEAVGAPR